MIHLLYDRVDRDSASITEHPIRSWPTIYRGFGREKEARKRGRRRRGEKIRSGIFRGSGTDRFRFIFIGVRWGGDRVLWGSFRFRPPLPPLDSEGLVGHFG